MRVELYGCVVGEFPSPLIKFLIAIFFRTFKARFDQVK